MKYTKKELNVRAFLYLILLVIIILSCLYPQLINASKISNNDGLLFVIWQIQAVVISFSLVAITILQSSFNVRVYGQKIGRLESENMLVRIICSLALILLMAFPVIKGYLIVCMIILVISLGEVVYLFWDILKIIKRPDRRGEYVKEKIKEQLDRFLINAATENEFVNTLDYLISHTKEMLRDENYIEAQWNQKVLNEIMQRLLEEGRTDFEMFNTILKDYKEIRNKYERAGRVEFLQKIDTIIAMER